MTTFTPEQLRTAAVVAEDERYLGPRSLQALLWRDEADRLDAEQSENAYLNKLDEHFRKAWHNAEADHRIAAGIHAVLAKLEADRLTAVVVPKPTPDGINRPWKTWREIPEGVWYTCRTISGWNYVYVNRDGVRYHTDNNNEHESVRSEALMRQSAPFHRVPRVWQKGDPEPEGVTKVLDVNGELWTSADGSWRGPAALSYFWQPLALAYGPLTEVLPEKETDR